MILKILWSLIFIFLYGLSPQIIAQTICYPSITENNIILEGDNCSWDSNSVHTFSIVEANLDGYKYWAYYALDHYGKDEHIRKGGLARSNDLLNWIKYEYNPIINKNCRWPTVVLHDGIFYMFYAEYNKENDSRIVMLSSNNGIDFENKTVVVPYVKGEQNQNPFIYFNENDSNFYLFYYNGTERAADDKKWNILVRKATNVIGIKDKKSYEVLSSNKTMAAPSIAYYNNTYYLLVEQFQNYDTKDKWVTNAFQSDKIDKGYKRVNNNPVLSDNDACAFQYILNNEMYVFYSHSLNSEESIWDLRMIKVK